MAARVGSGLIVGCVGYYSRAVIDSAGLVSSSVWSLWYEVTEYVRSDRSFLVSLDGLLSLVMLLRTWSLIVFERGTSSISLAAASFRLLMIYFRLSLKFFRVACLWSVSVVRTVRSVAAPCSVLYLPGEGFQGVCLHLGSLVSIRPSLPARSTPVKARALWSSGYFVLSTNALPFSLKSLTFYSLKRLLSVVWLLWEKEITLLSFYVDDYTPLLMKRLCSGTWVLLANGSPARAAVIGLLDDTTRVWETALLLAETTLVDGLQLIRREGVSEILGDALSYWYLFII